MYKINHVEITNCLKWLNYLKSRKNQNRDVLEKLVFEFENDFHFITKTNGYILKTIKFSRNNFYDLEIPQKTFLGDIYKQDIIKTDETIEYYPNYKGVFNGKILKGLSFDIVGKTGREKEQGIFEAFAFYTATYQTCFNHHVILDLAKNFPADNLTLYKTDSEKVMYSFKVSEIICFGIIMPLRKSKNKVFDLDKDINFFTMEL
jgi:hypothetical protein